jgi:hypothetical protein
VARRKQIAAALAVATVGAGLLVAATRAEAAAGCTVKYAVTNTWQGGFGVNVDITNLGDAINGWTLAFAFPGSQTVAQLWNGVVTQTGANVSVKDAGYNAALATGATTSFGFNGSGDAATPTSFSLNGTACTGGTTTPTSSPPTSAPPTTTPPPTGGTSTVNGKQVEKLDRGVVSVHSGSGNLITWRLLGTDPSGIAFNVYRGSTKLTASPVTNSTNYLDSGAAAGQTYTVKPVLNGSEQAAEGPALNFANGYLDVPIQNPNSSLYVANDAGTGDLDGDGKLDIVLKWDPTNAKDNSQSGVTDVVYVDGYKLDGTRLWRINLGRNIRAGAHYTQFQV